MIGAGGSVGGIFGGVVSGKFGRNKRVLDIKMTDGSGHRLLIDKFDGLVEKLTAASGHTVAPLAS